MTQTEYPFTLPNGFMDPEGNLHRDGTLMANGFMDPEGNLHRDGTLRSGVAGHASRSIGEPGEVQNEADLSPALLASLVTRLGSIDAITPGLIESLSADDLAYLKEFCQRIRD